MRKGVGRERGGREGDEGKGEEIGKGRSGGKGLSRIFWITVLATLIRKVEVTKLVCRIHTKNNGFPPLTSGPLELSHQKFYKVNFPILHPSAKFYSNLLSFGGDTQKCLLKSIQYRR